MATLNLTTSYTVNESEAQIIASEPKKIVKKPTYANRFHLTSEERKKRAIETLNKWR